MEEYRQFRLMKVTDLTTGSKELVYKTDTIKSMKRYILKNDVSRTLENVIEMDSVHNDDTREIFINDFILEAGETFKGVYGAYTLRKFT